MSMKTLILPAVLFSCLSLGACKCPDPPPPEECTRVHADELIPMPGDDCTINYNPTGGGYGTKFVINYNFTGDATGTPPKYLIWSHQANQITMGLIGGSRKTLLAGVPYEIAITEGSTTAVLKNVNNGAQTTFTVGLDAALTTENDAFGVFTRKNPDGTTNYTRVIVAKGNKNSYFDVN